MSNFLHVDLGPELGHKFNTLLPPGTKSSITRALVQGIVDDIEENGPGIIGVVLDRAFDLRRDLLGETHGKNS